MSKFQVVDSVTLLKLPQKTFFLGIAVLTKYALKASINLIYWRGRVSTKIQDSTVFKNIYDYLLL